MRLNQSNPKRSREALRGAAAACFLALVASCHSHDDSTNVGAFVPPSGSSGAYEFSAPPTPVQRGEFFDFTATLPSGGAANISNWRIITRPDMGLGGGLAERASSDTIRFVAGDPGFYALEATGADGSVGYYGFTVQNDPALLVVNDVIMGTDDDDVAAYLATSGSDDMFLAEIVGGSAAPQVIARVNRDGDRLATLDNVPYKVQDLAADAFGNATVIRTESTLTSALVRLDRDLNESTTFSAPDIAPAMWREVIAMTRDGETLVPTDLSGGTVLRLDADGAPVNGTVAQSLMPLGLPFDEVIDMATDIDGATYACTSTQIVRVGTNGTIDTVYWSPADQVAIRNIATDDDGVLFVSLQDADGGQCGSIRKLNWTGTQFRRIMEFDDAAEFAARKILQPEALGVFPDGAWRLYDDIVTLNPMFQRAAWILSSEPM